jgi:hypothetical protein
MRRDHTPSEADSEWMISELLEDFQRLREVAGAGTKGRYVQRLPSVSFALGLKICLIE